MFESLGEPPRAAAGDAERNVKVDVQGDAGGGRGAPRDGQEGPRLLWRVVGERQPAGSQAAGVDLLRRQVSLAQRVVPRGRVHELRVGGGSLLENLGEPLV